MPYVPNFPPDYTPSTVVPANMDNVYSPAGHGGVPNKPRAFIIHTPEERADNVEVTPTWFQQYHPAQRGSTHYYLDNDGDVYQCVPESWGAIANGFNPGIPQQRSYPAWAGPFSLNWQTLSVEVEGFAHNIQDTLNDVQFNSLVRLVRTRCQHYGIPLDRAHIMGHYELAVDRTDPGAGFPWARFIAALQEDAPMTPQEKAAFEALANAVVTIRTQLNDGMNAVEQAMTANKANPKHEHPWWTPKGMYYVAGKAWPF